MVDRSHLVRFIRTAGLVWILGWPALAGAQGQQTVVPALWGQGVKSCADYLASRPGPGAPAGIAGEEYRLYRQWLAGLVTGLNLAVGRDVLAGSELEAAMLRIGSLCEKQPQEDFFNTSLRLIRSLGQLQSAPGQAKP
ncbi:hypothetical protein [Allochromatium vinosum]|uniref:Rap1a immunity protein domain-containing protein n=1 Tax=Allochromatium vinosum (strain ATCC 17899 / DSM 180 / NBRC 103801 / NCIMB 10441 / D) TaxID=572477 RepID=D3RN52_ALLVD|nr:hypothetical protein [Allochromatium vinosum]ADC61336.1 hypothetical protein Alvin_0377 [Allochromatium vinosum DSM 180]MBK1654684.1 hypothetical protein [Allochromatium vinosum]